MRERARLGSGRKSCRMREGAISLDGKKGYRMREGARLGWIRGAKG